MGKARRIVKIDATVNSEHLKGRLKNIGGSRSDEWNDKIINDAVESFWDNHVTLSSDEKEYIEQREKHSRATMIALADMKPADVMEGMLVAQMIAAHNALMECYRRAMLSNQTTEGRTMNLSHAGKLSRTYAMLVDTLNKHRGKGQQKVTVEHVHIHNGGQAVVGVIEGGGSKDKLEGQSHAKQIANAPVQAMRGQDPEREPLPVSSDAERALPDARRAKPWSAKR